jgi:hypothetical protein
VAELRRQPRLVEEHGHVLALGGKLALERLDDRQLRDLARPFAIAR